MALNLSLGEFQKLTGISDAALLWLLKNNKLRCQVDSKKGLIVCPENLELQNLVEAVARRKQKVLAKHEKLLIEKMARIIRENFEAITEEAIARVTARHHNTKSKPVK